MSYVIEILVFKNGLRLRRSDKRLVVKETSQVRLKIYATRHGHAMEGCRRCSDVKSGVAFCKRQLNGAVDVIVNVNQEGMCSSKKWKHLNSLLLLLGYTHVGYMNILVLLLVKSAGIVFAKNISYIHTCYPTIQCYMWPVIMKSEARTNLNIRVRNFNAKAVAVVP